MGGVTKAITVNDIRSAVAEIIQVYTEIIQV